jgi:hypothetical protein
VQDSGIFTLGARGIRGAKGQLSAAGAKDLFPQFVLQVFLAQGIFKL